MIFFFTPSRYWRMTIAPILEKRKTKQLGIYVSELPGNPHNKYSRRGSERGKQMEN